MQLAPNCTFHFDNSAMLHINCDGCTRRVPRDAMLATTPNGDDFCEPCAREKDLWENPENARVVHFDVRMGEYMKQRETSGENRRDAERLLAVLSRFDWPELPPHRPRSSATPVLTTDQIEELQNRGFA